jgi:hypothetical protein
MNFEKTMKVDQEGREDLIAFRGIRSEVSALEAGRVCKELFN